MEDARQSSADAVGSGRLADPRRRLDAPSHRAARVDGRSSLVTIALPALLSPLADLIPEAPGNLQAGSRRAPSGRASPSPVPRSRLGVTFLAHQAWLMSDAIGRTLGRLYLTHRRLLEWTTAAQAKSDMSREITGVYRRMRGAPILAVAGGALVALARPDSAVDRRAVPRAVGPLAARGPMGEPAASPVADTAAVAARTPGPSAPPRAARGGSSRPSSGPADHDLPPDNFQEDPTPVVAHRTSPTNIGLYLLSTVAARDFGWLGSLDTARTGSRPRWRRWGGSSASGATSTTGMTRATFARWSPATCRPWTAGTSPAICSFSAMPARARSHRPLLDPEAFAGIEDALVLVAGGRERPRGWPIARRRSRSASWTRAARRWPPCFASRPTSPAAWAARLRSARRPRRHPRGHRAHVDARSAGTARTADLLVWAEATRAAIASHERVVLTLMPWASHLEAALAPSPPHLRRPSSAIGALLSSSPGPAALADLCEAAASELTACFAMRAARTVRRTRRHRARRRDHRGAHGVGRRRARALVDRLAAVTALTTAMFGEMQFGFLFDATRKIFSIGYRITDGSLDPSGYDLLASEARLTSFIAIAKGDVAAVALVSPRPPHDAGRARRRAALLVRLDVRVPDARARHALAGGEPAVQQTYRLVVRRQMSYGAEQGVPWGISESAYNVRDLDLTYQYSNFGVPGLGLERGLSDDLVIAPYATALAAMVEPAAAARKLRGASRSVGARGSYGFYEALDYTGSRAPRRGARGHRARLHGAPSGHDPRRAVERAAGRAGCARGFTRSPSSRRPSCSCRSARPGTSPSPGRGPRKCEAPAHAREFEAPVVSSVHVAPRSDSPGRICSPTGAIR